MRALTAALIFFLASGVSAGGPQTREEANAQDEPKPDDLSGLPETEDDKRLLEDILKDEPSQPSAPEKKTQAALETLIKGAGPAPKPKTTAPPPAPTGGAGSSGSTLMDDPGASVTAAAAPSSAGPTTVSAAAVQKKGGSAFTKAQKLGDQLKSTLRSAEGLPDLGGGPGGKPGDKPGAAQATSSLNPAEPKNSRDLAMAAMTGFKDSFERLGLREKNGAVVEQDGSPASQERLAALASDIKAEPKSLTTRPDFYAVISREKFGGLKKEIKEKPKLKAFKHLEVEQERDIVRSEACVKVSGDCNPFAVGAAYKKGDFVPPEELLRLADRPTEKDQDEPEMEPLAAPGPERVVLDAAARKPIYARLNAVFNAIKDMLGGPAQPPPTSGGAGGDAPAVSVTNWASGSEESASSTPVALSASAKAKLAAAPPRPGEAPAAASIAQRPALSPVAWGLGGLGLAALLLALVRRRDDDA